MATTSYPGGASIGNKNGRVKYNRIRSGDLETPNTSVKQKIFSLFSMKGSGDKSKWKKLSYMEAKSLSQFGVYLSEARNDHEGAIITLRKVSQ